MIVQGIGAWVLHFAFCAMLRNFELCECLEEFGANVLSAFTTTRQDNITTQHNMTNTTQHETTPHHTTQATQHNTTQPAGCHCGNIA